MSTNYFCVYFFIFPPCLAYMSAIFFSLDFDVLLYDHEVFLFKYIQASSSILQALQVHNYGNWKTQTDTWPLKVQTHKKNRFLYQKNYQINGKNPPSVVKFFALCTVVGRGQLLWDFFLKDITAVPPITQQGPVTIPPPSPVTISSPRKLKNNSRYWYS